MEDDDEFGDLYSDVLKPFSSAATTQPQPSTNPNLYRPFDSNLQSKDGDDNLHGASRPTPDAQTIAPFKFHSPVVATETLGSIPNRVEAALEPVVLDSKQDPADGDDVIFDIEEAGSKAIEGSGSDVPIIPGLTESGPQGDSGRKNEGTDNGIRDSGGQVEAGEGEGEGDDWDSDSDDDLQIVLNDSNHGPMAMERGGMMGEDDEDGDPLVIVADGDANQGMVEQDLGEGGGQAVDGEGKEGGEVGKVGTAGSGGGSLLVPEIGYSSHGFHPFHSQFKYVRPGAAPMPGVTAGDPGGAPAQVRPVMGTMVGRGRGRGDWRPPGPKAGPSMQKGFNPSFGMPGWGNNMGRGFGGGLDFMLPSHKTIFEVDIDSFEEKPWKYPGVDLSDFFNFGLNEESWKDYCKQLEQRRLETTMQSKIRVYESGRTQQDYDPDLPPELAAATGQEIPADAANFSNSNGGQNDLTKGTTHIRPPLPTGRAIQVEGGSGERLPSIDTRPPRIRDSDAIIEIICQDTLDDDSSTGNAVEDRIENGLPREDPRGDLASETDIGHTDTEYVNGFPNAYSSRKRELVERATSSARTDVSEDDGILPFSAEALRTYGPGSRSQSPMYPNGNFGNPLDERHRKGRARERSPHMTPIRGKKDKFNDTHSHGEESVESMDPKSPLLVRDAREVSVEHKGDVGDEPALADRSPISEKDVLINDTHNDDCPLNEKISSQVEQRKLQEFEGGEDSLAARISENSEARSGSSRDYQKWRDGANDEVVQGGRSSRIPIVKKHLDEQHDQNLWRKDRDARHEIERSQIVGKPREGSYPLRDVNACSSHNFHVKMEGVDRRRESDNLDVARQQREDDFYSRKRTEDLRKRERDDEMGSRNRAKVRESERSDKDDNPPRKKLDNGIYKVHHDKDVNPRHRERDDNLKSRYETVDGYHSKRRKDEEYLRRDIADKEVILHGNRESSSSRRKRERDETLDLCKRAEQQRIRDNFDHQSIRDKDEVWLQRERVEKHRERDEWHRPKQSHEESFSKREREGRGTARSGPGSEDKAWVGRSRTKDEHKVPEREYQLKETVRHSEQVKRRDQNDDESFLRHKGREDSYARGHQFSNDERKSRQERISTRSEHAANASFSQREHEKKQKENTRKNRESVGGDPISLGSAKRNQDDSSDHYNETGLKSDEKNVNPDQYKYSRKHREDASSNDERQESKRRSSKLECWTSHEQKDYCINNKSLASSKFKETEKINNVDASESNRTLEEPGTSVEPADCHHPLSDSKSVGEQETKDADTGPSEDRHLDTVEKLKKRSQRFKLPMPKEKDVVAIKKTESKALPSAKNETPADSEIKPERPARKRRWVSN